MDPGIDAKAELKQSYWLSFWVCVTVIAVTVAIILAIWLLRDVLGFYFELDLAISTALSFTIGFSLDFGVWLALMVLDILDSAKNAMLSTKTIGYALGVLVGVFIYYPIQVGQCTFFIRAPSGDRRFSYLFSSFKGDRYLPTVKTMFVVNLYIFLWSLLLIVPGIIKSYQYRMAPYIISETPTISPGDAMALSRKMSDGKKKDMLVLDLSFFGWYLLGTLACGIGTFFIHPYYEATWAQFYLVLKRQSLFT